MPSTQHACTLYHNLNALSGGLLLLSLLAMVATRQMLAGIRLFMAQSVFLATSAFVIGVHTGSWHLLSVGLLVVATRVFVIPRILRHTLHDRIFTRREISLLLNIPTSLFLCVGLIILACVISQPLMQALPGDFAPINLPLGLAGLLLGTYLVVVRREAVPQLLGILSAENGVLFAIIAIAQNLPVIFELAAALDVVMIAVVLGILTRNIQERVGNTAVGALNHLKEDLQPWN